MHGFRIQEAVSRSLGSVNSSKTAYSCNLQPWIHGTFCVHDCQKIYVRAGGPAVFSNRAESGLNQAVHAARSTKYLQLC